MINKSSSDEITAFWTIRPLNRQEKLSIALGRRKNAAVYFTSEERASSFREADVVERRWTVVEMPANSFVEWLRQRTLSGTHFIYRDPSNLFCLGTPIRIVELLIEIERAHSNGATSRPET